MAHVLRCRQGIVTPHRLATPALLLCLALVTPAILDADVHHDARIRPLDPHLQQLFSEGIARSETFRALVTQLKTGDVVVYVRYDSLPDGVHGSLSFLSAVSGVRYVLVALTPDLDAARAIVVLGHELRHAVEVLEQPAIVNAATFAAAYEHATYRRRQFAGGGIGLDTVAAVEAGVQVWKELSTSAPELAVAGTR